MELTHRTLGVRRAAALVAVTAAAALALPAAANAAVDGVRTSATTATLTGDEANDNIAISVSGANLAHNITGNGFNSNIDFDNVAPDDQTVPADTGRLTIDGGAGDDIIVGSKNLDTIRGGEGDDRLTGGPNNAAKPAKESISGGAGNDTMIWNNGDGDDVNDGGDGADETLFNNGTADDVMERGSARRHPRRASVQPRRRGNRDRHRREHGAPEHQRVLRRGHAHQRCRHDARDDDRRRPGQ